MENQGTPGFLSLHGSVALEASPERIYKAKARKIMVVWRCTEVNSCLDFHRSR